MDSEKREVASRSSSTFSQKEEIIQKERVPEGADDGYFASHLESQEPPQLKRTLKARHLAVSRSFIYVNSCRSILY